MNIRFNRDHFTRVYPNVLCVWQGMAFENTIAMIAHCTLSVQLPVHTGLFRLLGNINVEFVQPTFAMEPGMA
jgi:hypothetical protein